MTEPSSLDLILQTRLDVLGQVAVEVDQLLTALERYGRQLDELDDDLRDGGLLDRMLAAASTDLNDAKQRFPKSSPPRQTTGINPRPQPARSIEDKYSPEAAVMKAKKAVQQAINHVSEIQARRATVYQSFGVVRGLSISGGANLTLLKQTLRNYRESLTRIRAWREYENQLPRRGEELFSGYLELAGGMAVRSFRQDPAIDKAENLRTRLNLPVDDSGTSQSSPLVVLGMIGRRHRPFGYDGWSLWALPLIGRTAGENYVHDHFSDLTEPLRTLCADLYAQHVVGPSYLYASMFLDFDPDPTAGAPDRPSDTLRASLLLEHLHQLEGADAETMTDVKKRLSDEWQRARRNVGGDEPTLGSEDRAHLDRLVAEIRRDVIAQAYEATYELENRGVGDDLADEENEDFADNEKKPRLTLAVPQLLSAMWHGRLQHPDKASLIHERALRVGLPPESSSRPERGLRS